MNYDLSHENLSVLNLEFDGCHEVPIDIDFSLPDYCPDIQKILKCHICPNITARNISSDRLNIEGITNIKIIYIDSENMKIRCCENSSPFSASIDIKTAPANAIALTSVKVEYVNCRAVSPRKIDIHGAMSICTKILNKKDNKVSCCINGKDIEQKIENKTASDLISIGQQQFSINETLEPNENLPEPEMIVHSDVSLILNDYKTMPNKIVVKGEAIIKILYIDDLSSNDLKTMKQTVPISQIVDVPGADENSNYVITGEILSHEEQLRSESSKNMVNSEIKIAATVMVYQDKPIAVVSDAYSTDYNLETESESITLTKLATKLNEKSSQKSSLELTGTNILKIIDIWCDMASLSPEVTTKDNSLELKGKLNLCILGIDSDNTPFYLERITDFSHKKAFENTCNNLRAQINIVPTSINYSLPNSNAIDVKIDFEINGALYSDEKSNMITIASANESMPIEKDQNATLTIYYANENEPLWDIARKHHTCVNAIRCENNLEEDAVSKSGMILIPMK